MQGEGGGGGWGGVVRGGLGRGWRGGLALFGADSSLPGFQDLLNDLFACIFLGGAVAFAVQTRQSIPMNYLVALVSLPCSAVYLLRSHLFWRMVLFPCFAERASYLFTKCWDPSKV